MLNLGNFTVNEECMCYAGKEANYYMFNTEREGFTLVVARPNETDTNYGCGTLSTAIKCIEEIESGKEI